MMAVEASPGDVLVSDTFMLRLEGQYKPLHWVAVVANHDSIYEKSEGVTGL